MFLTPRYIKNSFAVIFPTQPGIRRMSNEFEDRLTDHYLQPHIFPVPDEMDPELPRMVFGSKHGNSQVVITQINFVLNVTYSEGWQVDPQKSEGYLRERALMLYQLLEVLGDVDPSFCGLTTVVQIAAEQNDLEIIKFLKERFLVAESEQDLYDLLIKLTSIKENNFFSNLQIQNYREYENPNRQASVQPLSSAKTKERGIQIIGDFNDRHAFNEQDGYSTTIENANYIINTGLEEIVKVVKAIQGEGE